MTQQRRKGKVGVILVIAAIAAVLAYFLGVMMPRQEAVDNAEAAISAMGEIGIDSVTEIEEAERLYQALPEKDRNKVENYSSLQNARREYDALVDLLQKTEAAVASIPDPANLEEQYKLTEARDLYEQAVQAGLADRLETQRDRLIEMEQAYRYCYADSLVAQAEALCAEKRYQEALELCNTIVQDYDTHEESVAQCAGKCFDALYKALSGQKAHQEILDLCDTILRNYDIRDEKATKYAQTSFNTIYKDLLKQKDYAGAISFCEDMVQNMDVLDDIAKQGVPDAHAAWAQEKIKEKCLEEAKDILARGKAKFGVSKEWEKANDTLTKKLASSRPANGKVLKKSLNWGYCEFTVRAGNEDACVKLESISDPSKYVLMYVHANNSATVKVADGSYIAKYTCGRQWYGEKEMFGKHAAFSKADDIIRFETRHSGNRIYYSEISITLYKVVNGNLETIPINPSQF